MAREAIIPINTGSAVGLTFVWPAPGGLPLDLTGWTLDLAEVSPSLSGHVDISVTDAVSGQVRVDIEALPGLPEGFNFFRPRAVPPAGAVHATTLPRFRIVPS